MTGDRRLDSIENKLDAHGEKLDAINETLKTIAVQDERIKIHGREIGEIKQEIKTCEQKLGVVCQYQASCPRGQIKFMWVVVAPMGFTLLVLGLRLLSVGIG